LAEDLLSPLGTCCNRYFFLPFSYAHTHTHTHTRMHARTQAHMHACTRAHTHIYTHRAYLIAIFRSTTKSDNDTRRRAERHCAHTLDDICQSPSRARRCTYYRHHRSKVTSSYLCETFAQSADSPIIEDSRIVNDEKRKVGTEVES